MDTTNNSTKRVHFEDEQQPEAATVQDDAMGGSGDAGNTGGSGDGIALLIPYPTPPLVAPPPTPYKALPTTLHEEEWKYSMRRQMQEILPGLFLGPYAAASRNQLEALKGAGITHIVCIRHLVERSVIRPVHEGQFVYLVLEMGDDFHTSLIPFCNKVIKFIDGCFQTGGRVLVHGNAGLNRSAALVVAYIMATYGVGLRESVRFVQSKRFAANPNGWFMQQLQEYEAIYQAMHDTPIPLPREGETTRPPLLKRAFDDISGDGDDDDAYEDYGNDDVEIEDIQDDVDKMEL